MIASPDATTAKPAPFLAPEAPGWRDRIVNIAWLVRRVAGAHPRSATLWFTMSLLGGLMVPLQLWIGKGTADNLQDRLDGGEGSTLWWFASLWVVVICVNLVAEQTETIFATTARERGGSAIAAATLDKATRIDLAAFEHQGFYDRIAVVLNDAEEKANDALKQVVLFGWSIPRMISWLAVLIVFDWRLALLAFVPLIPAIWAWMSSGVIYWDVFREQTRDRRLATYYASLLTDRQAAKEIRLFGLTDTLIERWEQSYWATARDLRKRGLRIGVRQRGTSMLSSATIMLGLVWYISIAPESISAGTAVIVVSSYIWLTGGILNFAQPLQELGKISGFATDLRGFLNLPEESDAQAVPNYDHSVTGEIRFENVTFSYPGTSAPVVRNLNLTILPGETIALVGENGAGKTTLVKLMLGLYRPDCGRVLLDGENLNDLEPVDIRRRLSGVFQHFIHYPFTATENVTLGEPAMTPVLPTALDLVGLDGLAGRLPNALETILAPDLGGVDLSGGQWQRIAIARAGIRDASVLALDEPTASLDPLAEVAIFQRFAELAQQRTTILVSHRLGMARLADRILVLEQGEIIEQGTHDDLIARHGSDYAAMWHAQSRWYQ
jgi:ATP-binding cassette subfamily B protein